MKKINLILAFFIAIAVMSCNPKQDRPIETNDIPQNQSVDLTDDSDTIDEISADDTTAVEEVDVEENNSTDELTDTDDKEPVMVENEDGSVKKVPEEEITKSESKKEHVKKFYIIAGSFKNINNAITLRSFFKERGYPSMILYPFHGYNRVATGSYPNRAAAEKDIKKFRAMNLSYEGEKIEYWLLWR